MKKVFLLIAVSLLASCGMQPYQSPMSGTTATILFDGTKMTPTPFTQRKLNVEFFDGCYEKSSSEGVLGAIVVKEPDFLGSGIKIPADQKLFVSYGIQNHCMLNWSFEPEAGSEYMATFDNVFGGCKGSLMKLENGETLTEPTAKYLELDGMQKLFGDPKSWRQCKNLKN